MRDKVFKAGAVVLDMEAPMARFRHLSVRVSGKELLHDIGLDIGRRQSLTILGPNGSGKTTLMRVFSGEVKPWSGDPGLVCELFGKNHWNIFALRHRLGIVSMDLQNAFHRQTKAGDVILSGFFESMDVYKNHYVTDAMRQRSHELASLLQVEGLLDREYRTLSLGEARRVLIARALVHEPETLILDEPMTGLDIVARHRFLRTMERLISAGTAIVLITHDLEDIPEGMDDVLMIREGRILAHGPIAEILDDDNLSMLFGVPMKVRWNDGRASMVMAGQ